MACCARVSDLVSNVIIIIPIKKIPKNIFEILFYVSGRVLLMLSTTIGTLGGIILAQPKLNLGGDNRGKHYSDGLARGNYGLLSNINNGLG